MAKKRTPRVKSTRTGKVTLEVPGVVFEPRKYTVRFNRATVAVLEYSAMEKNLTVPELLGRIVQAWMHCGGVPVSQVEAQLAARVLYKGAPTEVVRRREVGTNRGRYPRPNTAPTPAEREKPTFQATLDTLGASSRQPE